MNFLQGNDVLELIRNRSSERRRKFAFKIFILQYFYAVALLGAAVLLSVRGALLLAGESKVYGAVIIGAAAVDLALAAIALCRRGQFVTLFGRIACNVIMGATAAAWLIAGEGALIYATVHAVFWCVAWLVTVLGRLCTSAYSRGKGI